MNPAVKAGVIAALRDPATKQGRFALRSDIEPGDGLGGVCCLELVCHEAIDAGVIPPPVFGPDDIVSGEQEWFYGTLTDGDRNSKYLPVTVYLWAGLNENDPHFDFGELRDQSGYLYSNITWAYLNDTLHLTFPQIADMVDYFF